MFSYDTFLSKLQHKKIVVQARKKGKTAGKYLTKRIGASIEFNDYRSYQQGDDIRQIDWNVYGRTKKHYIKTYLDEHLYEIGIFLDYSNSLQATQKKWNLAKMITASLAFVGLIGEDEVQYFVPKHNKLLVKKLKGKKNAFKCFEEVMASNEKIENQNFMEQALVVMPKTPQMVFVISDFMEPLPRIEKVVKRLVGSYQYIYFIQVLDEEEINPLFQGDVLLKDSETHNEISISTSQSIIKNYQLRLRKHNQLVETLVKKHGGNYHLVSTEQDVSEIILKDFVKREILK